MTLYDADEKTVAKLVAIRGGWGAKQRLREMGVQVGDVVKILNRAPFGGPLAIQSGETVIAIGRHLARRIQVEPKK